MDFDLPVFQVRLLAVGICKSRSHDLSGNVTGYIQRETKGLRIMCLEVIVLNQLTDLEYFK